MRNHIFPYARTKPQISFAVTLKLISVFVFAPGIVQSLSFLNTKLQASSHFLRLRSLICVGPGRKPRRPVAPSMLHSKNKRQTLKIQMRRLVMSNLNWIYTVCKYDTGKYNVQCSDKRKLAFVTSKQQEGKHCKSRLDISL